MLQAQVIREVDVMNVIISGLVIIACIFAASGQAVAASVVALAGIALTQGLSH